MALTASNVRVGVSGVISKGLTSATAPTGTGSTLTGFTDLGYVTEDGVTLTLPGSGDSNTITAWQNATTVRTIRTPSTDAPQYQFVLMETSLPVIELWANATTSGQTSTEGTVTFNGSTLRPHFSFVIDVIDGPDLIRDYIPYGVVSDIGDQVYSNGGDPIGYDLTLAAEYDPVKAFNFKRFSTALKS